MSNKTNNLRPRPRQMTETQLRKILAFQDGPAYYAAVRELARRQALAGNAAYRAAHGLDG